MNARKELARLLAEAQAHLEAYEQFVKKVEKEAGALPAAAEASSSGSAAEERDDTLEGLR